jgi:hypothetical protein
VVPARAVARRPDAAGSAWADALACLDCREADADSQACREEQADSQVYREEQAGLADCPAAIYLAAICPAAACCPAATCSAVDAADCHSVDAPRSSVVALAKAEPADAERCS